MSRPTIEQALERHAQELMQIAGVVGTGIGESDGRPCIIVLVSRRTRALERAIPSAIDGYPVRIDEVGEIRPLSGTAAE